MDTSAINWLAVLVAAIMPYAIGFVWFGPLFGKPWMASIGMTPESASKANMAKVFGLAFVFQLIIAVCLAMFFYGDPTAAAAITGGSGAFYGFLTGFGWVSMVIATNTLFEQKSFTYAAIISGYWVIVFTLMGFILGVWK